MRKIFIAGHNGMAGSAVLRTFSKQRDCKIITMSKKELNLADQLATLNFIKKQRPDEIILAAAKVGGISANNNNRVDFLLENLKIQNNVIGAAFETGVKKFIFLGSSCIYPKNSKCPIKECDLLTDSLEYSNEPYAIAKIAGMKLCENISFENTNFSYLTIMPSNLFGLGDNYDLETGHVFAVVCLKVTLAKILSQNNTELASHLYRRTQKFNPNKKIDKTNIEDILASHGVTRGKLEFWGTGKPMREFVASEDLAHAICTITNNYDKSKAALAEQNYSVNCGSGVNTSISELVNLVCEIVNYNGSIYFNGQNADGTFQKDIDSSMMRSFGWEPKISLTQGIMNALQELK